MAKLKLVVSNRVVEYHELKDRTVLGRSREVDVLLADPAVSREHAVICREGSRFILEDLGSANGTRLNGAPAQRASLAEGDLIQIGDSLIIFTFEELAVEAERSVTFDPAQPPPAEPLLGVRDLQVSIPAAESAVDVAGAWLGRLLETSCLSPEEQQYFQMALHESLGNAWRHGSRRDPSAQITVRLLRDGNRVSCRVRDQGPGFDFRHALEQGRRGDAIRAARERYESGGMGGLGIMLIVKCVDLVEFNERGNEITLTKCPGDVFQSETVYGGLGFKPEARPPRP
jgi:anti-sigma regulatory factor (Ser/Thr protein kinase)